MRPSLLWGIRLGAVFFVLQLFLFATAVIGSSPGDVKWEWAWLYLLIPLPPALFFGLTVVVVIEVVRAFVLFVRSLERKTGDPGW
jgi:hypothetical protein